MALYMQRQTCIIISVIISHRAIFSSNMNQRDIIFAAFSKNIFSDTSVKLIYNFYIKRVAKLPAIPLPPIGTLRNVNVSNISVFILILMQFLHVK